MSATILVVSGFNLPNPPHESALISVVGLVV